jgi:hypothetical protein
VVTGTAREGDDRIYFKLFRKKHRIFEVTVKAFRYVLVGMNGIAVCGKGADIHAVLVEGLTELIKGILIGEQLCGVALIFAGITTRTDLNGVYTELFKVERVWSRVFSP